MCIRDRVYWLLCAWAAWGLWRAAGRSRQSRPRMLWLAPSPVSYTHLDVYKRQAYRCHQAPGPAAGNLAGQVVAPIPVPPPR